MESNWEAIKKSEKGRSSVTEGIPNALPALMLADEAGPKGTLGGAGSAAAQETPVAALEALLDSATVRPASGRSAERDGGDVDRLVGELLFSVADLAQRSGLDAEQALRAHALEWRDSIVAAEGVPGRGQGQPLV